MNKIIKMNNRNEDFYNYMGKFFGSRVVQSKINDRIYDDAEKDWYILLENEKAVAFASMSDEVVKNIYATTDEQLVVLLKEIKDKKNIKPSILPKVYSSIYEKLNFKICDEYNYKNFVVVEDNEKEKNCAR